MGGHSMKIIVVKICDGDVYFRSKKVDKVRAMIMAQEQVLQNDIINYDQDDIKKLRKHIMTGDYDLVYQTLVEFGTIREREFY
jgi:hypothetical protein